jgi:hypothetical protein
MEGSISVTDADAEEDVADAHVVILKPRIVHSRKSSLKLEQLSEPVIQTEDSQSGEPESVRTEITPSRESEGKLTFMDKVYKAGVTLEDSALHPTYPADKASEQPSGDGDHIEYVQSEIEVTDKTYEDMSPKTTSIRQGSMLSIVFILVSAIFIVSLFIETNLVYTSLEKSIQHTYVFSAEKPHDLISEWINQASSGQ